MTAQTTEHERYHHGDLRSAIIITAERILTESGGAEVTFRRIAREIGVSHNAPYRHFRNQAELFAAISQRGYGKLRQRLEQAATDSREDVRGLLERFGWDYVAFALENANLYRLMFSYDVLSFDAAADQPELLRTFDHAAEALTAVFAQGQHDGQFRSGDARTQALTFWSMLHGLALLWIDRQAAPYFVPPDMAAERAVRACVRTLTEGIGR